MPDILINDCGSILLFIGVSEVGKEWINDHLIEGNDEVQTWGPASRPGVVVEPRYAADIVYGAQNDGLEVSQ